MCAIVLLGFLGDGLYPTGPMKALSSRLWEFWGGPRKRHSHVMGEERLELLKSGATTGGSSKGDIGPCKVYVGL